MIFFKPFEVLSSDCTAIFRAFENEDKLGECRLLLKGNEADVYFLEYSELRPEIGEGLLKSAYNYAANRGAYIGSLSVKDSGGAHLLLDFNEKDGVLSNDIPSLLVGHCRCKNSDAVDI